MRSTVLALATLALALAVAGGAVASIQFGGQEVSKTLEGRDVAVGRETAAGGAALDAHTQDVLVRAKAPMCTVETEEGALSSGCEAPDVETNAAKAAPVLNVNVFVGFGSMEAAQAAEPSPAGLATFSGQGVQIPAQTILYVTAAAGAGAALLYAAWRGLKLLALGGMIPLYSHIRDDQLLDDQNRARIFGLIREVPGISTKDIADRLGLAWGTVTHHLAKLEKRRMVVSKKYGKYRRFFANGATPHAEDKDALAVLRVPATAEVATFIRENPGLTQKRVSEALGVSSSTILWHVKRLEQVGLVQKLREGKTVRYFPGAPGAATAIPAAVPVAVAVPAAPAPRVGGTSDFFVA